jgi:hypothetical protein
LVGTPAEVPKKVSFSIVMPFIYQEYWLRLTRTSLHSKTITEMR